MPSFSTLGFSALLGCSALLVLSAGCGAPAPGPAAVGGAPAGSFAPGPLEPGALAPFDLPGTKNVHVFDQVLTAGQPSVAGLEAARALGVRSVVNLRTEAEMQNVDFDERAIALGLGMRYDYLPWNGASELTDVVLDRMRELLNTAPRPLLFHCASANRVGAGWAAWRALERGLDIEAALAEGRAIGLRTEAYEPIVRDYVARMGALAGR